jgi:hypothetical protein
VNIRLILALLFVIGLGAENWWLWNKAKNSCIQGVLSGVSTFQKEQEAVAKEDVKQAEADTKTITELQAEIRALRERKNRRVVQAPTSKESAQSGCADAAQGGAVLPGDALDRVREAAGKTNPGGP